MGEIQAWETDYAARLSLLQCLIEEIIVAAYTHSANPKKDLEMVRARVMDVIKFNMTVPPGTSREQLDTASDVGTRTAAYAERFFDRVLARIS